MTGRCNHSLRTFFRHPYGDVGCFHVVERCKSCGTRTRPDWVPHIEVKAPELLPIDPWINGPWINGKDPRQGALW